VYAGFGLVAGSLGPVVGLVRADLGLSKSAIGLVLGAWQLVFLATATPAGRVIDRIGLRPALALAALVVCASGLARAVAGNLAQLYLAVALFGVGGPLISVGAPKLIADHFSPAERGRAVGIYSTAPSVGTMAALASANSLLVPLTGSWRGAMATYAVTAGVLGVLWWLVALPAMRISGSGPGPVSGAAAVAPAQLVRIGFVQIVLLLAAGSFLYSHALGNWLVAMLEAGDGAGGAGRSAALAGNLAAGTTLVGIAAALVVPRIATPANRRRLLMGVYLAGAAAVALVPLLTGFAVVPALLAVGIARSAAVPVTMVALMDHPRVGSAGMAAAGGLFFTAGEVGGVAGPLLVGAVADASGGFVVPALTLAAVAVGLAGLAGALGPVNRQAAVGPDQDRRPGAASSSHR
jgi:cyanate permease